MYTNPKVYEKNIVFAKIYKLSFIYRAMPTDIYLVLVIATVSLIVIGVIIYALYKAVKMLKTSLNDAREDSLPSPSNQIRNSNHNVPRQRAEQNISASNSSLPRSVSMGGITPTGTARRGANIAALPFFQGEFSRKYN